MLSPPSTQMCWICGKAVDLKTCKTDGYGNAVHGQCYAAKVASANGSVTPTKVLLELKAALAEHTRRLRKMAARKLIGDGDSHERRSS